jgi:hypothetical protein
MSEPDYKRFALAVLINSRDGNGGDVDGGTIEDVAKECGLLVGVEVSEPCGEYCVCAEYEAFPMSCYRYSTGVLKAIADKPEIGREGVTPL